MDALFTQTGDRPDLSAMLVNAPEEYIGNKILPIAETVQKSGTLYYATATADSAAETGRVAGVAPSKTQISTTSGSFSCAEVVKRGSVTPDEVKSFGDIAKADKAGATFAKRQVMKYIEADIAAHVLASGSAASAGFDAAKIRLQVQTAKQAVRRYHGRTTLVASTLVLNGIVQELLTATPTADIFSRIISGASPAAAIEGMNFEAWLKALGMFFGVDQVLAGDDDIWNATAIAGRFAIGKFDDGSDELAYKYLPVYGRNMMFLPDAANRWLVRSVADEVAINNHYDAFAWFDTQVLNSSAAYVFDGVPVS